MDFVPFDCIGLLKCNEIPVGTIYTPDWLVSYMKAGNQAVREHFVSSLATEMASPPPEEFFRQLATPIESFCGIVLRYGKSCQFLLRLGNEDIKSDYVRFLTTPTEDEKSYVYYFATIFLYGANKFYEEQQAEHTALYGAISDAWEIPE